MSMRSPAPRSGKPTRLHSAVFQPIGDEGRAALVERRIAEAIMGGVLAAGERLPAETELAAAFGVAPATAREALLALRERGLIVTRRGRNAGSFIADSADPVRFATRALVDSSRVTLRDAAQHYQAITAACVELAARRADPGEITMIVARLGPYLAAIQPPGRASTTAPAAKLPDSTPTAASSRPRSSR